MRLTGKTAIVTGAAAGIGAATARGFAAEGARLLLADRDANAGEAFAEALRAEGGDVRFLVTDIADPSDIEAMVAAAISGFGQVDILHNHASGTVSGYIGDLDIADWERSLKLGITPYFQAIRCVLPHMVERGRGSIVNTASISGMYADHGLGAYNVAKAAVINLTRNVAIDYARAGIRCNAVCPGIIFTTPFEQVQKAAPDLIDRMAESVPLGRFGRAEEVANAVLFLASDEASFVTGASLMVDGGRSAWTGTPSMLDGLSKR